MRKIILMLFCLVLIGSMALPISAEDTNSRPLTFSYSEDVYTVWAEYESDAPEGSLKVQFQSVQGQTMSNYKDGILYVAIVSTVPLDLSQPLAWVTRENCETAPDLSLIRLRFNEVPADATVTQIGLDATLEGDNVSAVSTVQVTGAGNCLMVTAAYDSGRMISSGIDEIVLSGSEDTVSSSLQNCGGATEVKVFFLSNTFMPLGPDMTDTDLGSD